MKSLLSIPLLSGKRPLGSCALVSTRSERTWPEDLVQRFRLITAVFANALARRQMEGQLRERLGEIERLKRELERENLGLRQEVQLLFEHREIVGAGPAIKKVLQQVEQVAKTTATVLLTGETGTGKELVARAIHRLSPRREKPLITVNCASLPPSLIESELFGREKGAFTGALTRQAGRFEIADGSTLFLDEIGELPLELQGKLLRVLEEGRFERLGSTRTIQVDVRVIAATHRDLKKEVGRGNFREDLYYRINVFPIEIPPLRERTEDIPLLVWAFVNEFSEKDGKEDPNGNPENHRGPAKISLAGKCPGAAECNRAGGYCQFGRSAASSDSPSRRGGPSLDDHTGRGRAPAYPGSSGKDPLAD